jgi:hypothetical protein
MEQKLTVSQALEQGYTYATLEDGEGRLVRLAECEPGQSYELVSKEGVPFAISNDTIQELVDDYLCNQDIVADEDGELNDIAAAIDYSEITKKLNEAFSVKKYYFGIGIMLIV